MKPVMRKSDLKIGSIYKFYPKIKEDISDSYMILKVVDIEDGDYYGKLLIKNNSSRFYLKIGKSYKIADEIFQRKNKKWLKKGVLVELTDDEAFMELL